MRRLAAFALLIATTLTLSSCVLRRDLTIVNACDSRIVVALWERPDPREARRHGAKPKHVLIPRMSSVTTRSALSDVDTNGSSASIVRGPGAGSVMRIPHRTRTLIIPARLCR